MRGFIAGWRMRSAVGAFVVVAAFVPPVALAQTQPAPSGGVVLSGGVSAPSAVQEATRGQPVVLPNTGGPLDQDDNHVATLALFGGLAAAGAGVYLRGRAAKSRIGG